MNVISQTSLATASDVEALAVGRQGWTVNESLPAARHSESQDSFKNSGSSLSQHGAGIFLCDLCVLCGEKSFPRFQYLPPLKLSPSRSRPSCEENCPSSIASL